MKRVVAFILCAALLAGACFAEPNTSGSPANTVIGITSPSAILMHPSGMILYEKNSHERLAPASVTKVMTLLVIFEALERVDIKLTDVVTASKHACSMGGSQIWLKEGEQMTVEQMIKCITVASANDCSVAMAEFICGTEESFVQKMNERAKDLGMTDTTFVNCCGLDAKGHLTTAYDIALMSAELLKHKDIQKYTLIWMDTIRNGAFGLTNTNKLVKTYEGITGLKTGSTSIAGFCLSATAERGGLALIAVVMKAPDTATRTADVTAMLNYGFALYSAVPVVPDEPLAVVPVQLGVQKSVKSELGESLVAVLTKEQAKNVTKTLTMEQSLSAPVEQGQQIGMLEIHAGEITVAQVAIVASESVNRLGLWDIFRMVLKNSCACARE